jgi:hypothetical protein
MAVVLRGGMVWDKFDRRQSIAMSLHFRGWVPSRFCAFRRLFQPWKQLRFADVIRNERPFEFSILLIFCVSSRSVFVFLVFPLFHLLLVAS